jgi:hypothetical protein
MLPFGVTIPATVPQESEIPEGLINNPVFRYSDIGELPRRLQECTQLCHIFHVSRNISIQHSEDKLLR